MSAQETTRSFPIPFNNNENFNRWLYTNVRQYLKGVVLEIGSGTGNLSSLFIEENIPIILTDPDKPNRDQLRELFRGKSNLQFVENIDFNRSDFEITYAPSLGTADTILAMNILDNGFYTDRALLNVKTLSRIRGHFIFIAPFKTIGYPGFYEDIEEIKRNNYRHITPLLHNCEVLKSRYFTVNDDITRSRAFGHAFLIVARKQDFF